MWLYRKWDWTRCYQRSLAWVSMSLSLVAFTGFRLSFPDTTYWASKSTLETLSLQSQGYLVNGYTLSIATQYCNYLFICEMPLLTSEFTQTKNSGASHRQDYYYRVNNKSFSDHICQRIRLLNIFYNKMTDNSVLTRILSSLKWLQCAASYKTFTKSRCCEVGWNRHSDTCKLQNSLSLFGNWDHVSAQISWFRDIDYFNQGCIINILFKSQNYKEYKLIFGVSHG